MNKFKCIPAYYEWYLINNTNGEVVYFIVEPENDIYDYDSVDDFADFIQIGMENCEKCKLDKDEIPEAAHFLAEKLFNYYKDL